MLTFVRTAMIAFMYVAGAALALADGIVQVRIRDLGFSPATLSLNAGDTVEWINDDFIDHTATARLGDWDLTIPAGQSARLSMTKVGRFEFYCRFHPNMIGTIEVVSH